MGEFGESGACICSNFSKLRTNKSPSGTWKISPEASRRGWWWSRPRLRRISDGRVWRPRETSPECSLPTAQCWRLWGRSRSPCRASSSRRNVFSRQSTTTRGVTWYCILICGIVDWNIKGLRQLIPLPAN